MTLCRRCNQREVQSGYLCSDCTESVISESRQRHVDQDWSQASNNFVWELAALFPIILLGVGLNILLRSHTDTLRAAMLGLASTTFLLSIGSVIWDYIEAKRRLIGNDAIPPEGILRSRRTGVDWGMSVRSIILCVICVTSVAFLLSRMRKEGMQRLGSVSPSVSTTEEQPTPQP